MKKIFIVLIIAILIICCTNKIIFELTALDSKYGYYRLHDDLVPSYNAIYLVSNYSKQKDSLLIDFVKNEFEIATKNNNSLKYVSISFYKKTCCTKKFLSINPYGKIAIGDPSFGCFDDMITSFCYEKTNKDSNKWLFVNWLNNTTDTIEAPFYYKEKELDSGVINTLKEIEKNVQ